MPRAARRSKAQIRADNETAILRAAEEVFANHGFKGASTGQIAEIAGIPKANLHYYFPTKEDLYRRVIDDIFNLWMEAAASFDRQEDPVPALSEYIRAKMHLSRTRPLGSRIWASEIISGAPVVYDALETTLKDWTETRVARIDKWVDKGLIAPVNARGLLYMIWATTQHYADFARQIAALNNGRELSEDQFEEFTRFVIGLILRGIGAVGAPEPVAMPDALRQIGAPAE